MYKLGFSLIELMVVIAIIALLAAVAVPAYSEYTDRAKVSTIVAIIDDLGTRSKAYYAVHGVWPNLEDLNYTDASISDGVEAGVSNIDYLDSIIVRGDENCAMMEFFIDPTGLSAESQEYMLYGIFYGEDENGMIRTACSCETDEGWGSCAVLTGPLKQLDCGVDYDTQTFFACSLL